MVVDIAPKSFKKQFAQFKSHINEIDSITPMITKYFSSEQVLQDTDNYPLIKVISTTPIAQSINTTDINRHATKERQRNFNDLVILYNINKKDGSYYNQNIFRKVDTFATMFLTLYYSDIDVIVSPNYQTDNSDSEYDLFYHINELYNRRYSDVYISSEQMFTRLYYKHVSKLIPYIYHELALTIKSFFKYDTEDPNIVVSFYKCYNRNNEIFTRRGASCLILDTIYQPFIHFFNNTPSSSCTNTNPNMYNKSIYNYTIFPYLKRIYSSEDFYDKRYYKYDDKDMVSFKQVTNDKEDETDAQSDIISSFINDMIPMDRYINTQFHIGNLLNNLYINIEDHRDKDHSGVKYYLIEYNKSGASKKIIENVLNVGEVIMYNIKNHKNMISSTILEQMASFRNKYKELMEVVSNNIYRKIITFNDDICRKYLYDVYRRLLHNDQIFANVDEELAKDNIIIKDTMPLGMFHVDIHRFTSKIRPYGNIDKRLKIIFNIGYKKHIEGYNNIKDISFITEILRTNIALNYSINDMISNSVINIDAIKIFMHNQWHINTIEFDNFDRYYMKISYYVYTLLNSIKKIIIPFIHQYYMDHVDDIFDMNDSKYIDGRRYYKKYVDLYKKHVKCPTLEENNQSDKSVNLQCENFMTQLSYYSTHFDMNVVAIDRG